MLQLPGNCFQIFKCFHQPIHNQSQFHFHPYCVLFFLLFLFKPCVCHTQLLFIENLEQSSFLTISFANSIPTMDTLKTINRLSTYLLKSPRPRIILPGFCNPTYQPFHHKICFSRSLILCMHKIRLRECNLVMLCLIV